MVMSEKHLLQYPIVLVHGLGALGQMGPIEYFYKIPGMLRRHGNRVAVVNLALWNTIDHCAQELDKRMQELYPGQKVNLIGHSMGGLVSRLYTTQYDKGQRVASVTTIGSPNKGTAIADHFLELFLNDVMAKTELLAKKIHLSHFGFRQLSKKYFDENVHHQVLDVPGVAYFSATSIITKPIMFNSLPTFWATQPILKHYEGDNDGFVSEESARYGSHICTYHGDHYAQIGQPFGKGKLDHLQFFGDIVARLHRDGF